MIPTEKKYKFACIPLLSPNTSGRYTIPPCINRKSRFRHINDDSISVSATIGTP